MQLIDFNDSKSGALAHGFFEGSCCACYVVSYRSCAQSTACDFFAAVMRSDFESMQHDWEMIGSDMQSVVKRYEQNQTNASR